MTRNNLLYGPKVKLVLRDEGPNNAYVARLITKYRDDSAAHFVRGRAHSVGQE